MSYTKFVSRYRGCRIRKPKDIKKEKAFPVTKIFACMDIAANKGLLDPQKKRCDVVFVSELPNQNTLSIFIEMKERDTGFSDIIKQLENTVTQMIAQDIFDNVGKEQISLIFYSNKGPKSKSRYARDMRSGIEFVINNKRQKVRIFHSKKSNPMWNKALKHSKTF